MINIYACHAWQPVQGKCATHGRNQDVTTSVQYDTCDTTNKDD